MLAGRAPVTIDPDENPVAIVITRNTVNFIGKYMPVRARPKIYGQAAPVVISCT